MEKLVEKRELLVKKRLETERLLQNIKQDILGSDGELAGQFLIFCEKRQISHQVKNWPARC